MCRTGRKNRKPDEIRAEERQRWVDQRRRVKDWNERIRRVLLALADGRQGKEVAVAEGITPARVSQIRKEWAVKDEPDGYTLTNLKDGKSHKVGLEWLAWVSAGCPADWQRW